jgi:hypothetical protein
MIVQNVRNSGFGKTERNIARWLAGYPWVKQNLKKIYQFISWVFNKKSYTHKTNYSIQSIKAGDNESFFGYYDKNPVSHDGKYILFCSSKYSTNKNPDGNREISVILQELNAGKTLLQIPVRAYNWQQGSRVHWLTDDLFIFNDFDTDRKNYTARVWSAISLSEVKSFDRPVQDSYKDEYFLSLNYQRIMALRPDYGYRNLPILDVDKLKDIDNDGIWKVDYKTGEGILLVSLKDVCLQKPVTDMERALHKVNHIMISPFGDKFIFIHRYYIGKRRFDRLFLADSINGNLKLLSDNEMVSHYFWVDNKTFLAYLRDANGKDAYNLIDIDTGSFSTIANDQLNHMGDGHPHVYKELFITDTYPDRARMQHLVLVNWKTGEVKELGEFFHGFKYSGETRCDLHPRFSSDGKSVFFDSVFSGKRQLYRMNLSA